jgi:hypothetical protein
MSRTTTAALHPLLNAAVQEAIAEFLKWDQPPALQRTTLSALREFATLPMPEFRNERKLRDYQEVRRT